MEQEKAGNVVFKKKRFNFVKFIIKILLLIVIVGAIYALYAFGLIKKEYIDIVMEKVAFLTALIKDETNAFKFILAMVVLILSNILLTFYLLTRKSGSPVSNLNLKSQMAKREKEVEKIMKTMREDNKEMRVKFSSVLLRYRELLSSLDKDEIIKLLFAVLEKSANCRKISIFLIDDVKKQIFMFNRWGGRVDKQLTIDINDKNAIAYCAKEGAPMNIWSEEKMIQELFQASPVECKVVTPLVKDKVTGVICVEQFKDDDFKLDEETRIIIQTTAKLAAISLDKANVFEMTTEELQSEKKFSAKQIEEKKALRNTFTKYTSPQVVDEIIKNPDMIKLGGKKSYITVLFSDIVGFTTYSEKYPPEKVVSILNQYLTAMTDVIMEFNGTLDKFVGDEIMAIWGAPVAHENSEELAVRCGFGMLKKLHELQKDWEDQGIEPFNIGIGINSGDMIVGNMGSPKRMDYTVIGDAVNTGARIESLTRQFQTSFIVSETTYLAVKDFVEAELLGKVSVKGKKSQVKVYKLLKLKE
ncbi:MAG: hypothetical protein C0601_01115 [Candidatus Muiribacterium halophilum]|uniref:Guanylate cyclase domain-containing protein n=1 Tax=Muiribacterium halophilum TaxID=2053465 RepID=A0A2N5ZM09_MUIH1|nr:MAG: hypothetical protein C0601_01115 [Candidatus Muirbacterium halophilum]